MQEQRLESDQKHHKPGFYLLLDMSDSMIMEDVLLSEGAFSLTDELEDLFPEEFLVKSEAMKKSPGHMSVASVDSGFGYTSPHHSLPDLDSAVIGLQDLIEDDSEYLPLELGSCTMSHAMATNNTPNVGQAPTEVMASSSSSPDNNTTTIMDTSGSSHIDVSIDEVSIDDDIDDVFSIPDSEIDRNDDLQLLLNCVSMGSQQGLSKVAECEQVSGNVTPVPASQRPIRATRSGKTFKYDGREQNPVQGPSSRVTRSKSKPRKLPKQSPEELENINMDDVDKSQKNAVQARINRQKKKAYIQGLEDQVEALSRENEVLKKDSKKFQKERDTLEEEVKYYKSVLANDSQLAVLLQNIGNVSNVRFTTSFDVSRKRSLALDHDYGVGSSSKKRKTHPDVKMSGGVCLHVDKDNVSLEFCSKCSKMANGDGHNTQS